MFHAFSYMYVFFRKKERSA